MPKNFTKRKFKKRSFKRRITKFVKHVKYGGLNKEYAYKQIMHNVAGGTVFGEPAFQQQTSGDQLLGFDFRFSDLPQYTSFTAIYDQYKIDWIIFELLPQGTEIIPNSTLSLSPVTGTVIGSIDLDNSAPTPSMNALREYSQCKEARVTNKMKWMWKPHIGTLVYNSIGLPGYSNTKAPWIDCAYPSIPHYGLKIGLGKGATTATGLQQWNVSVTFLIKFRNVI